MNAKTLSALVTLFSGIGLCIAGFCVECLVYAGAIFNVRLFILREIRKHFDKSKES